jgi:hypothetical protein
MPETKLNTLLFRAYTCPHCLCQFVFQPWRPKPRLYCSEQCEKHANALWEASQVYPLACCTMCMPAQATGASLVQEAQEPHDIGDLFDA